MKRTWWLVLLLAVFVLFSVAKREAVPAEGEDYAYIVRSLNQTMTGACSGEVRPDRAVIVGGVTAESVKPGEAKAEIEKQLQEIQRHVSQQGGTVHLMERVRAVRGTPHDGSHIKMEQLPFVVIQRLEVEFPLDVDIDAALERLLQLGLDRYGRNIRPTYRGSTPNVVVHYRFSDLTEKLKDIHQQCKTRALQQWCEMNAPAGEHTSCTRALTGIAHRLITQRLMLQSQPVLRAQGMISPFQISYPWNQAQLQAIELIGDVPLRLHGTITVKLPRPQGW
ncbi:MAG: SIMPL domain-containing protein [Candidatus Methylomirabilales bacterium]